jgi:hypothetical protein
MRLEIMFVNGVVIVAVADWHKALVVVVFGNAACDAHRV